MSLETNWCLGCKHHDKQIPTGLKEMADALKEYKYKIYCKKYDSIVVANPEMWIDKTVSCEGFER
jgi:hypothetical protein